MALVRSYDGAVHAIAKGRPELKLHVPKLYSVRIKKSHASTGVHCLPLRCAHQSCVPGSAQLWLIGPESIVRRPCQQASWIERS